MKINRHETFSIEGLSKEEVLFLFEVIEKLKLTPDSTPISFQIAEKFKAFRKDLFAPAEEDTLVCDGCETLLEVEMAHCPVEDKELPLCPVCLLHRKHHMGIVDVQSPPSTTP